MEGPEKGLKKEAGEMEAGGSLPNWMGRQGARMGVGSAYGEKKRSVFVWSFEFGVVCVIVSDKVRSCDHIPS